MLRSGLFWNNTQRTVVIPSDVSEQPIALIFFILKYGTDRLCRTLEQNNYSRLHNIPEEYRRHLRCCESLIHAN